MEKEMNAIKSNKKIRIVVVDNFVKFRSLSLNNNFFIETLKWKLESYLPHYNENFVPLDKADFFSRHHLFCFEEKGELLPFSGIRHVSLKRCHFYNTKFPLLETVTASASKRNIDFLKTICHDQLAKDGDIIYPSGYSISPKYLGDQEIRKLTREFVGALHFAETKENKNTHFLTASVMRFKTYRWFELLGYKDLYDKEGVLPNFCKRSANNEELKLMSLKELSPWCRESFEKHRSLFENKIQVSNDISNEQEAAA